VARATGFLDWSSQPSLFKHYPNFLFRYRYNDIEALRCVELARMISATTNIASKPYHQLTIPSAGNLHPVELYVQIRGVKGVLSGIYHVDAGASEIVLIREIEKDGLEAYVGLNEFISGMLFIVTIVPFRAEWKYQQRAIRYCYLDAGHQIGALRSSLNLYEQKMTILSEFDKKGLNEHMGFKDEEFVCAVAYSGKLREGSCCALQQNLMYVAPTHYSELQTTLVSSIEKNELMRTPIVKTTTQVSEQDILQRRSARYFDENIFLTQEQIKYFMDDIVSINYPLSCYVILLRNRYKKAGVYCKNRLIKEGVFTEKMCALLVDQKFIKNADMLFIITSKYFSSNSLMQAGSYVHELYMQAQSQRLGCSGIGAFYDKKMQEFLDTQEYILYVSVIGVNKK
jgi:SagB-type dehydrogenase family enzyme